MATKKNDIALSFDKAEYYTLQEASEYLNRKHDIDNITPKKLLKHIINFITPCYVFARGFELTGDYITELFDRYRYEKDNEQKEIYLNEFRTSGVQQRIAKYVDDCLSAVSFNDGLFLEIPFLTLQYMPFHGKIDTSKVDETHFFRGVLPLWTLNSDSKQDLFFLKRYLVENYGTYVTDILAMYPSITIPLDELDEFGSLEELKNHYFSKSSLKIINYYEVMNDTETCLLITPYFEITEKDLFIIHDDLETLDRQLTEKTPIPRKEQPQINDIQSLPRVKGKSPKKVLVQEMARFYALAEWENDTDKEIKQTAMADKVWRKLADVGFSGELQSIEQVKAWIKPVAPPHAKEAGRPSNS